MEKACTRKDIPPWVKVPEDLKDPEVLQVQSTVLKYMFGEWQVLTWWPRLLGLELSFPFPNRPTGISNPSHRAGEPGHVRAENSGISRTHRDLSLWLSGQQAAG